jgi:photosystem II stability/assembly factor-like uncharacterized protein
VSRFLYLCLVFAGTSFAADRWVTQFFHDEDKSALTLNDLQFASATRGIAVGYLTEKRKVVPTAIVTSDGGKTWSFVTTKEIGISVFFLTDASGWMVTGEGIWFTNEAGRSWKKIRKQKGLIRVFFVTPEHGWAVGALKTIIETKDGGKTWTKLEAAAKLDVNPENTAFTFIDFMTQRSGIIVGKSHPTRSWREEIPIWMDPHPSRRRELPTISVFLETKDEGATWTPQMSSLFGQVTRFRLGKDGRGIGLVEYENFFEWPSEVLRLDLKSGQNFRALRRKDRAITDVALVTNGPGYVAGFQPGGSLAYTPVPGPVKVLRSDDLMNWTEMEVDYRAVATRVTLAAVDADNIWMATDTGMILKLNH